MIWYEKRYEPEITLYTFNPMPNWLTLSETLSVSLVLSLSLCTLSVTPPHCLAVCPALIYSLDKMSSQRALPISTLHLIMHQIRGVCVCNTITAWVCVIFCSETEVLMIAPRWCLSLPYGVSSQITVFVKLLRCSVWEFHFTVWHVSFCYIPVE